MLTNDQLASVNDYLSSRDDSYIATLIAFDAKANAFPAVYFNDSATSIRPEIWWKGMKSYCISDGFIDIATHLLTSPASSASIERVFSSFGVVHNKARNRLGNAKAAKLVYCYRMLRGKDERTTDSPCIMWYTDSTTCTFWYFRVMTFLPVVT